MGTAYNANIVTDGLVLCLDAANPRSYPGSGTTWYDLSGNGNHGDLATGSMGLENWNNRVFNFDGSNEYIYCGYLNSYLSNITDVTFMCYAKIDILLIDSLYMVAGRYEGGNGWVMSCNPLGNEHQFVWGGRESASLFISTASTFTSDTNIWYFLCGTKKGSTWSLYINGQLNSSTNAGNGTTVFLNKPLSIGRQFSQYYWNGQIANSLVYNRALSANEVKQNFNATRGRYGI